MKKINFILLVLFGLAIMSCDNGSSEEKISTDVVNNIKSAKGDQDLKPYEMPKITFEKTKHDFGNVIQGEKVVYNFAFTNTGKSDLLISTVSTSCGCTVGKYPKTPIKPGDKGSIEVVFDTKGRKGFQTKNITVMANTNPSKTTLNIISMVQVPEEN